MAAKRCRDVDLREFDAGAFERLRAAELDPLAKRGLGKQHSLWMDLAFGVGHEMYQRVTIYAAIELFIRFAAMERKGLDELCYAHFVAALFISVKAEEYECIPLEDVIKSCGSVTTAESVLVAENQILMALNWDKIYCGKSTAPVAVSILLGMGEERPTREAESEYRKVMLLVDFAHLDDGSTQFRASDIAEAAVYITCGLVRDGNTMKDTLGAPGRLKPCVQWLLPMISPLQRISPTISFKLPFDIQSSWNTQHDAYQALTKAANTEIARDVLRVEDGCLFV